MDRLYARRYKHPRVYPKIKACELMAPIEDEKNNRTRHENSKMLLREIKGNDIREVSCARRNPGNQ